MNQYPKCNGYLVIDNTPHPEPLHPPFNYTPFLGLEDMNERIDHLRSVGYGRSKSKEIRIISPDKFHEAESKSIME